MKIELVKIMEPPVVRQIYMLASPSKAWQYIVKYYRAPTATEKVRLEHAWLALQMADGELPLNSLTRARYNWKKREEFAFFSRAERKTNISHDTFRTSVTSSESECWQMG